MNRQIKFRIYNNKTKQWIHGPGEEVSLFGEMILLGGFLKGVSIQDLEHCVALQFTEALDKNGNEIYDGDIVKTTIGWLNSGDVFYTEKVKWGKCGWVLTTNLTSILLDSYSSAHLEVIGNVFDNNDLLKKI